jgi:predicted anti-sigma-YlaC factor YlaD
MSQTSGLTGQAASRDDMTCAELAAFVSEYLDGALARADCRRFDEHLVNCPDCVVHLRQIRETISVLGELPQESISPETAEVLLRAFRDWRMT